MASYSFVPFLNSLEGKKQRTFENEGSPVQGLKVSFLCNL